MKNLTRILSVMLSCIISGMSLASPSASADDNSENAPVSYDNTKLAESKELAGNTPFQVFDIYNAYYGITTETSSATTATTTAATTTVTTAATTKTTAVSVTTSTATTTETTTTESTTTIESTTGSTETTVTTTEDPTIPKPLKKGIDVSEHQSYIDWNAVKESGEVDFVIIRAGYGKELNQVDRNFYQNIEGAKNAGLDVGIYWYSYADDAETAKREADVCYQLIKDYSFNLPVYFDIEERKHMNMTTAEASIIVDTFCSEMESKGYYVGVYSYANFLQTHVYKEVLNKYDVWVAQYYDRLTAYSGHYSTWQYSSQGVVDGIKGVVDMNYCYKDFSEVINVNPDPAFIPVTTTADASIPPFTTTTATKNLCDIVVADQSAVDMENISDKGFIMLDVNGSENEPDWTSLAENIENAKANSRRIGLIWEAKTTDLEKIKADAEALHGFVEQYQFEYPLYLDLTSEDVMSLSADEASQLIRTFCSVFDADKKHYIGVRGYDDFLTDNVNGDIYSEYDVWLITDDDTIRFGYKYGFISTLSENGYIHECKRNYPAIMVTYHLNGF